MAKALTIAGLVVAALVLLLFSIDLFTGIPFGTEGKVMDIGAVFASAILVYLSLNTLRELR
ncbi:MAG: hypothetical protein MK171_12985 [Pirellulales bacterium]|nr:hypothetical protein [Pirellulales bacterium]